MTTLRAFPPELVRTYRSLKVLDLQHQRVYVNVGVSNAIQE